MVTQLGACPLEQQAPPLLSFIKPFLKSSADSRGAIFRYLRKECALNTDKLPRLAQKVLCIKLLLAS